MTCICLPFCPPRVSVNTGFRSGALPEFANALGGSSIGGFSRFHIRFPKVLRCDGFWRSCGCASCWGVHIACLDFTFGRNFPATFQWQCWKSESCACRAQRRTEPPLLKHCCPNYANITCRHPRNQLRPRLPELKKMFVSQIWVEHLVEWDDPLPRYSTILHA